MVMAPYAQIILHYLIFLSYVNLRLNKLFKTVDQLMWVYVRWYITSDRYSSLSQTNHGLFNDSHTLRIEYYPEYVGLQYVICNINYEYSHYREYLPLLGIVLFSMCFETLMQKRAKYYCITLQIENETVVYLNTIVNSSPVQN